MPYSEYVVKDRKALSQLKYQMKRFGKQMAAAGVAQEDQGRIKEALTYAFQLAAESHDFEDDGRRIYYGENQ